MEGFSSNDDDALPQRSSGPKRRRLHGACDSCRKKKVKCDSARMPGNICSNCIASHVECAHDIPRQSKKESQEHYRYIRALEDKLNKMEDILRIVMPELDVNSLGSPMNAPSTMSQNALVNSPKNILVANSSLQEASRSAPDMTHSSLNYVSEALKHPITQSIPPNDSSEDYEKTYLDLTKELNQLSLESAKTKFFGPSSGLIFAKHASNVQKELLGKRVSNTRRDIYWNTHPWEHLFAMRPRPVYVFPDPDLLDNLINIYFNQVNILLPVLHRPTFEKAVATNLHLWDNQFGMVVLLVCSVASRYSADPRNFLDNDSAGLSAGWKYFSQIPIMRDYLIHNLTVYDLQYYCLSVYYFFGASVLHGAWTNLGLGIRYAQERGIHRQIGNKYHPTIEDELWKRAFWGLISLDRLISSSVGRPCALQDEDIDTDYPIECDDDFWEGGFSQAAISKQLANKPSLMTGFNLHLRLCEILNYTLRTLYSTKKAKFLAGFVGDQWEQRVVSDLDSSLNKWVDSIPDYLRWDPTRENSTFFRQSAMLYATYYYVQIQAHRPFIQRASPLSFSSLAICTNAARSCSHLLAAIQKRGFFAFPNIITAAFAAGVVLRLHIWGGRPSGSSFAISEELADVQHCMDYLEACEGRWHLAGRLHDLLVDLGTAQEATLPSQTEQKSAKRPREPPCPMPTNQSTKMFPETHETASSTQPSDNLGNFCDNSLDLSNILLTQLGYGQANNERHRHDGPQNTSTPHEFKYMGSDVNLSGPMDENMMSVWSGAPTGFDVDDWDAFTSWMGAPLEGGEIGLFGG